MIVEATISVIDRLIELLKLDRDISRQIHEIHIQPIFSDLEKVNADYFESLAELARKLQDPGIPLEEIEAYLRIRRESLAPLRIKVQSMGQVMNDTGFGYNLANGQHPLSSFSGSIDRYFTHSTHTHMTGYSTLLDLFSFRNLFEGDTKDRLEERLPEVRKNIENSWREVTTAYAKLTMYSQRRRSVVRWFKRVFLPRPPQRPAPPIPQRQISGIREETPKIKDD